ncbi:hypothetical protein OHQ90_20330 [Nocardia sp. NBC_00403]
MWRWVVAVARKGELPLTQIAKDFGISQSCVKNWVEQADEIWDPTEGAS